MQWQWHFGMRLNLPVGNQKGCQDCRFRPGSHWRKSYLNLGPKLHFYERDLKVWQLSLVLSWLLLVGKFFSGSRLILVTTLTLVPESASLRKILACCAFMNKMPSIKSKDKIRGDLGVVYFMPRLYYLVLYNGSAIFQVCTLRS